MTPWEAIHRRFGVDEQRFRASRGEHRELLAFWVEGTDVGDWCVVGIDQWNAGGIDEIIDLNGRFLRAFLDCIEADQVGGKDEGPFVFAKLVAECSFRGTRQLRRDREGVIHPTRKFTKSYDSIDDPWQVESLRTFVKWVLTCDAVDFYRQREPGEAYPFAPEWTNVFVWAKDPAEARRHIEARLAEARESLAGWVVTR